MLSSSIMAQVSLAVTSGPSHSRQCICIFGLELGWGPSLAHVISCKLGLTCKFVDNFLLIWNNFGVLSNYFLQRFHAIMWLFESHCYFTIASSARDRHIRTPFLQMCLELLASAIQFNASFTSCRIYLKLRSDLGTSKWTRNFDTLAVLELVLNYFFIG